MRHTFAAMNTRLQHIIGWCDQRHISQQFSFFRGCDPSLEADQLRIYYVLRRPHMASDTDAEWIAKMERIINKLN